MFRSSSRLFAFLPFLIFGCSSAFAQTTVLNCAPTANPPLVRAEGLTERVGDIVMTCTGGQPNMLVQGNLTVFTNVPVTNRISSGTTLQDVALTYDIGTGQQATVPATLGGTSQVNFLGVSFRLSATGTVLLRITDVRVNVTSLYSPTGSLVVFANVGFSPGTILLTPNPSFVVAYPRIGLYTGSSSRLVCSVAGSPAPSNLTSFSAFLAAGSVFTSTRLTEGFADAFQPRTSYANFNADSGHRFLISYSGFPSGAALYVPDVVAGSDAVRATAGGDFGPAASGGQYAPSVAGTLLLARVTGADANGAGGTPVYTPGAVGSGTVSFNSVSPVGLDSTGSGYAVYEVVDANNAVQESAQFPMFLTLAPASLNTAVTTNQAVSFAPVSTVGVASTTAPIPRFESVTPPLDCTIVGDCGATYYPALYVDLTSLQFTAQAGTGDQAQYVIIQNRGGGVLRWTATVTYATAGASFLQISPASGINNGGFRVDLNPGTLAPGTYQATITVDGGPTAGTAIIPVTVTVTAAAAPAVNAPAIASVVNAASFVSGAVVPGSLSTIMGSNFAGKTVIVMFDNTPAQVLFSNSGQINVLVPANLANAASTQLTVTVDGVASAPQKIAIAPFAPAIFPGAVVNQDWTVNSASQAARPGSILQIFATGLSGAGTLSATINGQPAGPLYYGGPAPGFSGVQQIDLALPAGISGTTANVAVCGTPTGSTQASCSSATQVYVAAQ